MKFSKIQVITAMKETGMVPVFYHSDIEVAKNVM
jgi:2-dehydro-3-deoxyphosphogluconate aldolase/(4S)-4-hydroxy-2-oxoglutarate aldolase